MNYTRILQFYSTGTGNCFQVSQWLKEIFKSHSFKGSLLPIEKTDECKFEHYDTNDTLMVIVMPPHGFTLIWAVLKWCLFLPRIKNIHAVVIAARAGWKLGPFFMPGMSGSSTFITAILLKYKGYKVKGLYSVDMPSNWIAAHWGISSSNSQIIYQRAKQRVNKFITTILNGNSHFFSINNTYELLFGILLLPISFMYIILARFALSKVFFANFNCDGCSICAKNCPCQAIKMVGNNSSRPFWTYHCESCMRCMAICPKRAIEASHPWFIFVQFCTVIPVSSIFISWMNRLQFASSFLNSSLFKGALDFLFVYFVIFSSYYLFYFLTGFKWINWIMTKTTPTFYFRRYRNPRLKLSLVNKVESYSPEN